MKCYEVTCEVCGEGRIEKVGLMCDDLMRAAPVAEKALLEGKRLTAKAISTKEVERI